MTEILRVFDENYNFIGTASRAEVHQKGLWHETFHCWLYFFLAGECQLILQKRSAEKKDFPNQFDISAAGHLLAHEEPADGLRELTEELGISVPERAFKRIGYFPVALDVAAFHDREFPNIFLLEQAFDWDRFKLQEEEVAGLVYLPLSAFRRVMAHPNEAAMVTGFLQKNGEKQRFSASLSQGNTCCHSKAYFTYLFKHFEEIIREKSAKNLD